MSTWQAFLSPFLSREGAVLIPASSLVPGLAQATSAAVRPQGFLRRSTATVALIGAVLTGSVSDRLGSNAVRFAIRGSANCCLFHPSLSTAYLQATFPRPRFWAAPPFARRVGKKMISEGTTSPAFGLVPWNSAAG